MAKEEEDDDDDEEEEESLLDYKTFKKTNKKEGDFWSHETVDDVVKKYEAKELTAARAWAQLGLGLEDFKVNILSLCKGHWL